MAGFLSGFASNLSASQLENEASAEWSREEEEKNGGCSYSVLPPMQQVFLGQNIMMSETIIAAFNAGKSPVQLFNDAVSRMQGHERGNITFKINSLLAAFHF